MAAIVNSQKSLRPRKTRSTRKAEKKAAVKAPTTAPVQLPTSITDRQQAFRLVILAHRRNPVAAKALFRILKIGHAQPALLMKGKSVPSDNTLIKLCQHYDIPLAINPMKRIDVTLYAGFTVDEPANDVADEAANASALPAPAETTPADQIDIEASFRAVEQLLEEAKSASARIAAADARANDAERRASAAEQRADAAEARARDAEATLDQLRNLVSKAA